MRRIHAVLVLVVLATVGMLATGCTKKATTAHAGGSTAPSSRASTSAKNTLLGAVIALTGTTSTFTMTLSGEALAQSGGTTTLTGGIDPVHKAAAVNTKAQLAGSDVQVSYIVRPEAMYIRFGGLPATGDAWMKVDPTRLPASLRATLLPGDDLTGILAFSQAVGDVTQTSPGNLAGTVDLAKAPGILALSQFDVADLHPDSTVIPFTATVDAQGRLSGLTLTMKLNGKELKTEMVYRDFGAPAGTDAPDPAQTTEATDLVYQFLNGLGG